MKPVDQIAFLLDVDNTLLDNDRFEADFAAHLQQAFGRAGQDRYWQVFEARRAELGYADYLGAVQRFRSDAAPDMAGDPRLLRLGSFLLNYSFADRLYPGALDAIAELKGRGKVVILSDGDAVFQPHKIHRSGLWDAVEGQVLIYIHKEAMVADLTARYPAAHYVLVDDKPRILAAMKRALGPLLTSVFVNQGHFARDPAAAANYPAADVAIEHIHELRHLKFASSPAARAACDTRAP